jgi:hypothetical protein
MNVDFDHQALAEVGSQCCGNLDVCSKAKPIRHLEVIQSHMNIPYPSGIVEPNVAISSFVF